MGTVITWPMMTVLQETVVCFRPWHQFSVGDKARTERGLALTNEEKDYINFHIWRLNCGITHDCSIFSTFYTGLVVDTLCQRFCICTYIIFAVCHIWPIGFRMRQESDNSLSLFLTQIGRQQTLKVHLVQ